MKTSLLFILIAHVCCLHAQTGFEKVYTKSGSLQLIELGSHNVLIGLGGGAQSRGASLMSPVGDILQSNSYWGSVLGLVAMRQYADNQFYFVTGYVNGTCISNGTTLTQIHPAIGRMDTLMNVSDLRHYELNQGCSSLPRGLEVTVDHSVIIWGWQYGFFALKVDSNLTPVWSKHFDRHGSFQFIRELPSGDLMAGINMDTAGVAIARLDPDGNFIWCKSYIRPGSVVHDCVIESDSSFVITGYTDSLASTNVLDPLPVDYDPKLFMMKLNGTGDVQWCKGYDGEPKWYARHGQRIVKALDGNYVLLANIGVQDHYASHRPFLMKTDLNGDTLWTRSAAANYSYGTTDLLAYSDGGYLFDGIVSGDLPEMNSGLPYIFKTDSLGHLPCIEQPHPIQVVDLFPVDSSFMLTSADGAIAIPDFVVDTAFSQANVYDACEVFTGLSISSRPRRNLTVRPNPNTGRFIVGFNDPLMAGSYYSVYDITGRLLFQRQLPAGATVYEIDLTRFSRGTYTIKVIDPEGVRQERVVLE